MYRRLIKEMRQGNTAEMSAMANTLEEFSEYILNAWTLNKTNCNAESVNSRIRKVIRDRRGFYNFEHLREACLIALGRPREHKGSVKLYQDRKGDS